MNNNTIITPEHVQLANMYQMTNTAPKLLYRLAALTGIGVLILKQALYRCKVETYLSVTSYSQMHMSSFYVSVNKEA